MPLSGFNARQALRGQSMVRAADAMLRVLGGTEVWLRLPGPPMGEATAIELGLAQPVIEDVPVSPVVILPLTADPRRSRLRYDLLFSASSVNRLMDTRGFDSVEALFNGALGVIFDDKLLHVESLAAEMFGGVACLYRVTATE